MLKVLEEERSCVGYVWIGVWIWTARLDMAWCWLNDNATAGRCDVSLALGTYVSFSLGFFCVLNDIISWASCRVTTP